MKTGFITTGSALLSVVVCIAGCSKERAEPVRIAAAGAQTPAPAQETEGQIEEAPRDVKFRDSSSTLQELEARAKATLVTPPSPGSGPVFIWIADSSTARDPASIKLNRAYHVRQEGKTFWGFIDVTESPPPQPINDFIQQRHVEEGVAFPTDHHDGNHSSVELLDRARDGASVYKIVYVSAGGSRPHQEIIAIFLLYRSPQGAWALASNDLGDALREGASRLGWEAISETQQMRIEWTPGGEAPFRVLLETQTYHSAGFSGNFEPGGPGIPDYATARERKLGGPLPLQLQMSGQTLFVSQRDYTLRDVARIMTLYRNRSATTDEARLRADSDNLAVLQPLNPGVGADERITKDRRIAVPNEFR
jgi:hypothetical protein